MNDPCDLPPAPNRPNRPDPPDVGTILARSARSLPPPDSEAFPLDRLLDSSGKSGAPGPSLRVLARERRRASAPGRLVQLATLSCVVRSSAAPPPPPPPTACPPRISLCRLEGR